MEGHLDFVKSCTQPPTLSQSHAKTFLANFYRAKDQGRPTDKVSCYSPPTALALSSSHKPNMNFVSFAQRVSKARGEHGIVEMLCSAQSQYDGMGKTDLECPPRKFVLAKLRSIFLKEYMQRATGPWSIYVTAAIARVSKLISDSEGG